MPVMTELTEYISINDDTTRYEATNVTTGVNAIAFTVNMSTEAARAIFKSCYSLKVYPNAEESTEAYGVYDLVDFESTTEIQDNRVIVSFHIPTKDEIEMRQLKATVEGHDEILAELMFGGEA